MWHRFSSSSRRPPRSLGAVALAGLLVPAAAAAQGETLQRELARCRAIAEPPARLTCYDALAGERTQAPAAVAPTAPASATAAAASPGSSASGPAGVTGTAAAPAAATSARFGLEHAVKPESDELRSQIAGSFDGWEPKTRFRLANGQVWAVADGSRAYYPRRASPAVRLTRGALGSFFMEVEGVSHAVPVRRVE